MTSELKQEYTRKITQANKTRLIVILYEMLLEYTGEAKQAYEKENRTDFREAIRKARGCLNELMASLHFEYEPAMNLLQLYLFINRQLALADIKNSKTELDSVEMVIKKLHAAYLQVSLQDASPAVMENTQAVYAGLTYGKTKLTESLNNQGSNRGFCI